MKYVPYSCTHYLDDLNDMTSIKPLSTVKIRIGTRTLDTLLLAPGKRVVNVLNSIKLCLQSFYFSTFLSNVQKKRLTSIPFTNKLIIQKS